MKRTVLLMGVATLIGSAVLPAHADDEACLHAEFMEEVAGEIANQIAEKSWEKHEDEFVQPTPIKGKKMPFTLKNKDELATFIEDIMLKRAKASKDKKSKLSVLKPHKEGLDKDRSAWWDDQTGTLVIHDPGKDGCGSAYRPDDGKDEYDGLI